MYSSYSSGGSGGASGSGSSSDSSSSGFNSMKAKTMLNSFKTEVAGSLNVN